MAKTLNSQANAVLMEFGGVLPESYLSFEDVKRELMSTRALELQRLGISPTNKTVTYNLLDVTDRDGTITMPTGVEGIIPAAVEFQYDNDTDEQRFKVTIVAVDLIPSFEGERAIAFYGEPLRYRLSWDSWEDGSLYLYYDEIQTLEPEVACDQERSITFPPAFWILLTKKTAFNLIGLLRFKIAALGDDELTKPLAGAMDALEGKLAGQVAEWTQQFNKWIQQDLSQSVYVRRTQMEIQARNYHSPGNTAFGLWE